jgi:hypothetical protein
LWLAIQQQPERVAARPSASNQQPGYLAVVILCAIPLLGFDGAREASRAVTAIAGVTFVAIQHRHADSMNVGQRLVSLQTFVDVMNALSQLIGINQGVDASDRVGAAQRPSQPALPESGGARPFEGIEASHPGPEQNQNAVKDTDGRDAGFPPPFRDAGEEFSRQAEDLLGIRDQASKNGSGFPFLEPFPFQFGNFFVNTQASVSISRPSTDGLRRR